MTRLLFVTVALFVAVTGFAQRWDINPDGQSIVWTVGDDIPHEDHIEMSGERIATVLRWAVREDGSLRLERSLVFPLLRTIPNNTHGFLKKKMGIDIPALMNWDEYSFNWEESVKEVTLDGVMTVRSTWPEGEDVEMTRTIFPSRTLPALVERYELRYTGDSEKEVLVPELNQKTYTVPEKGVEGQYVIHTEIMGSGAYILKSGDCISFDVIFQGYKKGEEPLKVDPDMELAARRDYVKNDVMSSLILETPDKIINTEFNFTKLRASESIINTKGGYMHAPGGESYYAAIWANDQAEYVNPFFPYLGYGIGNESALNSFRHFARFMNDEYEPIPSSIIAEGIDIWNGAGDRGDAAMIAHGASRYALALGDRAVAEELWPLIEWCLEFCKRKLTEDGVVASDSDELEGRFPSGDANLCTSTLYYDGLNYAAILAKELGKSSKVVKSYQAQAAQMAKNIESHFAADMCGYDTYRYFEGNKKLRSWICMPLIVGLKEHSKGTIDALLGPELMTDDGLLTEQGSVTFWDRSTLYAMRGIYMAGEADRATEFLHQYSERRLLGDHVPYPVEAWPEGSQRHLSAESGLYCRIFIEGLFGIHPAGLRSFNITPSMPSDWDTMSLRKIKAYGSEFDVTVDRVDSSKYRITVKNGDRKPFVKTIKAGSTLKVTL